MRADVLRVAILGDSHFDERHRLDDCIRLHDAFTEEVARREVSLVAHAGDLYERRSTPDERRAAARWLARTAEHAPAVLIRGNHDEPGDLSLLQKLRTKHPILVEEAAGVHLVGGVSVGCLSWPRQSELLATLVARGESYAPEAAAAAAVRELGIVLEGFRDGWHPGAPRLLLPHAMVRGSTTSVGQPLVGCELEIGTEDLARAHADFTGIGHIHKAQEFRHDGRVFAFTGSPRRTAYGETEQKSFILVTFERTSATAHGWSVAAWERVALPAPPMLLLESRWENGAFTGEVPDCAGAEVRFQYDVALNERVAARRAADALRERLLAGGARDVKIDPVPVPENRARAPEVARAATLGDKLDALWAAKGVEVPADGRARLAAKLEDLEETTGWRASTYRGGALTLQRAKIQGFGPFAKPVEIDFTTLPGPIVHVSGENGAGKTTLLELMLCGALYRRCPTRGSLKDLATSKDASLEVDLLNGATHRIRHTVAKSFVLDADGNARGDADAKKSGFDAWAKTHLPAEDVFLAGPFSQQKSLGFLDLTSGERKNILVEVLGIAGLEKLAGAARARRDAADRDHAVAAEDVARSEARLNGRAIAAAAAVTRAEEAAEAADAERVASDLALAELRAAIAAWEAEERIVREREQALAAARLRATEAEGRRAELARQREQLAEAMASAAEIRAAADERAQLIAEEPGLRAAVALRAAEVDGAERAVEEHQRRMTLAGARAGDLEVRAAAARRTAEDALERARARVASLDDRIARDRALVDDAAAITAGVARLDALDAEAAALDLERVRLEAEAARLRGEIDGARRAAHAAAKTLEGIGRRRAALEGRIAMKETVTAAEAALPALRAELARAEEAATRAATALSDLHVAHVAGASDRIGCLRDALGAIEDGVDDARRVAKGALLHDDRVRDDAATHPERVRAAEDALAAATNTVAKARAALLGTEQTAATAAEIARLEAELAEVTAERDASTSESEDAATRARAGEATLRDVVARQAALVGQAAATAAARADLEPLRAKAERLKAAHVRIEEIEPQRADAGADVDRLEGALAALPADGGDEVRAARAEVQAEGQRLEAATGALAAARETRTAADAALARVVARLAALAEVPARVAALARAESEAIALDGQLAGAAAECARLRESAETLPPPGDVPARPPAPDAAEERVRRADGAARAAHEALAVARADCLTVAGDEEDLDRRRAAAQRLAGELADWTRLAQGLGRDGIQAMEIDAAGPELTALTNDLLHTCHGPRWTVSVETTRADSTGKRLLEDCFVTVFDGERGREGDGKTLSGGEGVIVGEAMSLALTMLGCRRAGVSRPTLVRDESGAALSEGNQPAYGRMLRRAAEVLGAAHILVVAHHAGIAADSFIRVRADGTLEVSS